MAVDAELYFNGENPAINRYEKIIYDMQGRAHRDMYTANHKIASSFFGFDVQQEVSYLLGNGVTFHGTATKDRLGKKFDLEMVRAGKYALIAGVSFGFWNFDHLEVFKLREFVPLYDEENGSLMAGIRFWQVADDKPLRATLYEVDGYTDYIQRSGEDMTVLKDKIIEAGINILVNLISGIIKAIPQLIAALPQIITAIVQGIGALMGSIIDIGKNIVEGIWEGIKGAASWLIGKVTGFFNDIVGSVKDFLGIHSPSKLFRDEIGRNIGLGVAEGLEDSENEAVKAANNLAESVYEKSKEWLDRQTKYQNLSLRDQLEVWETIQGQFIKESKQYADAEEEIFNLRTKIREDFESKASEINQNILDLEESYQNQLSSRTKEIFDSFGLFDQIPERQKASGEELLSNLSGQITAMEDFYNGLNELAERGVGAALVEDIRDMGPDAISELDALLSLSDEKLNEYASL